MLVTLFGMTMLARLIQPANAVKEIVEALDACRDNKTPCEIILKDLTTVKSDLSRLIEWSDLIMKVAEDYE